MKNSEKIIKYIDLGDAAEELGYSRHYLIKDLLKLGSMICIRFDDISSRMVKIVPPKSHQKFIDYRINPGDIHCLTLDSSKRIERMLKKSELVFEGLRLEIDFGGYPLTLQIVEDDPGMHIVVNQKDLDLISKLTNKTGFTNEINIKTNETTHEKSLDRMDQLLILIIKFNPGWTSGEVWHELGRETIRRNRKYDKENILLNFRDNKKDTLLWNSGRGKYKQSSLGLNTLRNRITELRKAGLIE